MVTKSKVLGAAAISAAVLFMLGGCTQFEESGLPGSASSMARNQMMWIRKAPPTFGYYRLESLSQVYPDLGLFTARKGLPDFLAETANRGRSYFILYYLDRRQAFACRNRPGQGKAIEFAGPYPITDKEFRTLDQLRRKGSSRQ